MNEQSLKKAQALITKWCEDSGKDDDLEVRIAKALRDERDSTLEEILELCGHVEDGFGFQGLIIKIRSLITTKKEKQITGEESHD